MNSIRIPVFEPTPSAFRDGNAIHMADPPIAVEAYDVNHVRLIVGGRGCLVDGIALCRAVNDMLTLARKPRHI